MPKANVNLFVYPVHQGSILLQVNRLVVSSAPGVHFRKQKLAPVRFVEPGISLLLELTSAHLVLLEHSQPKFRKALRVTLVQQESTREMKGRQCVRHA